MEKELSKYLEKHGIKYIEHHHEAMFTVEEASKLEHTLPKIFHTKNLFLKDENKNKYPHVSMILRPELK